MSTTPEADRLSNSSRKAAQHDRLIAAMAAVCARDGYRDATIANAIGLAPLLNLTSRSHAPRPQQSPRPLIPQGP